MLSRSHLQSSLHLALTAALLLITLWQASLYVIHMTGQNTVEDILNRGEEDNPEGSETPKTYHVAIDPGHGGFDPGAMNKRAGIVEKELTLTVSLLLRDLLQQQELDVFLTRDEDMDFVTDADMTSYPGMSEIQVDLARRIELVHEARPLLFISVHVNTYTSPLVWGAQALYHPSCDDSGELAIHIQSSLRKELSSPRHAISYPYSYLAGMLETGIPSVIVEIGFMTNPEEARRLVDASYQEKISRAIAGGIDSFIQSRKDSDNDVVEPHPHYL